MSIYVGANGVKEIKNIYVGHSGVKDVKEIYVGVNGTPRKVWPVYPYDETGRGYALFYSSSFHYFQYHQRDCRFGYRHAVAFGVPLLFDVRDGKLYHSAVCSHDAFGLFVGFGFGNHLNGGFGLLGGQPLYPHG